jgi:hypothetical protein
LADVESITAQFAASVVENVIFADLNSVTGWVMINDSDTINWNNINDTGGGSWNTVDDTQNPGWTPVNNNQG